MDEHEKYMIESGMFDEISKSDIYPEILNNWPLKRQKNIIECFKEDSLLAIELKRIIKEKEEANHE